MGPIVLAAGNIGASLFCEPHRHAKVIDGPSSIILEIARLGADRVCPPQRRLIGRLRSHTLDRSRGERFSLGKAAQFDIRLGQLASKDVRSFLTDRFVAMLKGVLINGRRVRVTALTEVNASQVCLQLERRWMRSPVALANN